MALIDDPITKAGQINVETYRGSFNSAASSTTPSRGTRPAGLRAP